MSTTPVRDGSVLGQLSTRRKLTNGAMGALVYVAFGIALIPLIWLAVTVVSRGIDRFMINSAGEHVFNLEFLQQSMRGIFGGAPEGGILHAIWGTLIITGVATVISVPIGLLTSIYLVEYGKGRLKRAVTFFVDVMTGIPSIVAGLFAYALFSILVGPGTKNGFTGAVALSLLMIPVVVRASEEMLRLVPNELREASYALGVPKYLTVIKVVLRTAFAGITTGVTLAIARVIGETAPLLIAVGVADSLNFNPFDGRMMTLPVYIVTEWHKGQAVCTGGSDTLCIPEITEYRAWGAALVLILIVMALNLLARLISRYFSPKTGR
ncbi:phosphate ABC transporter permease PstA [Demequina capsici]|uniref:Phosphate transport system permease protein PstA n=1 Tax=Demequina capsici TaxID=3075620 RepID=A0AA96FFY1_9MICO|nr:phosphate ABC transporter permease PstA [Demequina sp. PMTSA13]WNM27851.1 phosphate ABC transporter permease PstA [Demequina sp. PMTSA13]